MTSNFLTVPQSQSLTALPNQSLSSEFCETDVRAALSELQRLTVLLELNHASL